MEDYVLLFLADVTIIWCNVAIMGKVMGQKVKAVRELGDWSAKNSGSPEQLVIAVYDETFQR